MMISKSPRVKGETTPPIAVLALVQKIGVTRASKELGTSTTTLHKARKNKVVSRVVEVAASHVLEHLGDVNTAPQMPQPEPAPAPKPKAAAKRPAGDAMFLLSVDSSKAELVVKFAELLQAELVQA